MTMNALAVSAEIGLLQLSDGGGWIWAFTCPTPGCGCRTALILATPGDREALLSRGRPVADAWTKGESHAMAAAALTKVTALAIDLDTLLVYPAMGDGALDLEAKPAARAVVDRLDDGVLDAIAGIWHRGKGLPAPSSPGADGAKIEIEEWRPGDLVVWHEAQLALRGDTYIFGERIFEAIELYCVERDCACGEAIVDFSVTIPRGAPHPGHVRFDGSGVTLEPEHERHRERLTSLWEAYVRRHPRYLERVARRGAIMHGLAGRIVAAPPKPKVGRNDACPCGSGRKHKKCCGAA